jgi:transposase
MPRKVRNTRDHTGTSEEAVLCPLLSPAAVCVYVLAWAHLALWLCMQEPCKRCGKLTERKQGDWHHLCTTCDHERRHTSSAAATASASSAPSLPPPLFDRLEGCIDQLTHEQRAAIITLHKLGMTTGDIAHKIPCSVKTVPLWVERWEEERSLQDKERSGRPRCTDEQTDIEIESFAEEKKFTTPKEIIRELQLPLSCDTVRRRLNEVGLYGRVAQHHHAWTAEDIRRRLSFAHGYRSWTEADWERVIFCDETRIDLTLHGQVWVQRPVGAALDPQYTKKEERLEGRVSLWGCFCAAEIGQAEIYIDTLDAARYRDILAHNLLPSSRIFFPSGMWYLLQDNAPIHTAGLMQRWFHEHGITLLDFPPWSPDLNPIENLWAHLKRRVERHHARTEAELERQLKEEWEATDKTLLRSLAHSMPARLQAVIDNKGGKTPY